jgi:hypothetical protein
MLQKNLLALSSLKVSSLNLADSQGIQMNDEKAARPTEPKATVFVSDTEAPIARFIAFLTGCAILQVRQRQSDDAVSPPVWDRQRGRQTWAFSSLNCNKSLVQAYKSSDIYAGVLAQCDLASFARSLR